MDTFLKKIKLLHVLIFYLLLHVPGYSQDSGHRSLGLISPSTSDFIRYGNIDLPNATGEFVMSIPLYTYEDRDFKIPIELKYGAAGFKPSELPSNVGLHWHLAAGGVISRTVNGAPDDIVGKKPDSGRVPAASVASYIQKGFWVGMKETGRKFSKEQAYSCTIGGRISDTPYVGFRDASNGLWENYIYSTGDVLYDYQPDIFKFSFNGVSGSFIIGNNGEVEILEGDKYSVDLTGFTTQSVVTNHSNIQASTIKIKTLDGYTYVFGGNQSNLEIIKQHESSKPQINSSNIELTYCYISAWHLSEIISPNGRKVVFSYGSTVRSRKYATYNYSKTTNNGSIMKSVGQYEDPPNGTIIVNGGYCDHTEETKICHLTAITVDNQKIVDFLTNISTHTFLSPNEDVALLNRILVKNQNNVTVKDVNFEYRKNGKYHFLTSVEEGGKQPYEFEYIETMALPDNPGTYSLDMWGYWKGGNTSTLTNLTFANYEDILAPSPEHAKLTLLERISYPTGGYTRVEYEANTYSKRIKRVNKQLILDSTTSKQAGGLRVASITDSYLRGSVTRQFKYVKNYAQNTQNSVNSGVMNECSIVTNSNHTVRFYAYSVQHGTNITYNMDSNTQTIRYNSYNGNYNLSPSHLLYSEIAEINQNGYSVYKFTTCSSNPDILENNSEAACCVNVTNHNGISMISMYDVNPYDEALAKVSDMSRFRGKLTEKKMYTNQHKEVSSILYSYSSNNTSNYVAGIVNNDKLWCSYKIYTTPCLLLEKTEKVVNSANTNGITKKINYTYNSHNLLKREETATSVNANDKIVVQYNYLPDIINSGTTSTQYTKMQSNNMIGIPMEITKTRGGKTIEARVTTYDLKNNLVLPAKELVYSPSTSSNYVPFKIQAGTSVQIDPTMKTEVTYDLYNSKGYPLQFTEKDGIPVCVVWGYGQKHPVAKISGATFSQVKTALGRTESSNDLEYLQTYSGATLDAELNKLKNTFKDNANVQVSTYTHKPMVGIISETKPDGIASYYEYDTHGRLNAVKDNNKHIVKKIYYHYGVLPKLTSLSVDYNSIELSTSPMDYTMIFCYTNTIQLTFSLPYEISSEMKVYINGIENEQGSGMAWVNLSSAPICPVYISLRLGSFSRGYTLNIINTLDGYAFYRANNGILSINEDRATNGGYDIDGCEWYEIGYGNTCISTAKSLPLNGKLATRYYAKVKLRQTGKWHFVCRGDNF